MSENWYYADHKGQTGPLTFQALKEALATLPNAKDVLVWREGFSAWKKAADVIELSANAAVPPPLPNAQAIRGCKETQGPSHHRMLDGGGQRLILLPIIYLVAALAFGVFVQMQQPFARLENLASWYTVGAVVGIALPAFVIPAMVALIVWAFLRFRPERSTGPLITWFGLLLIYCAFMGLGAIYGKQQDLALMARTELTETTRKAFVAGINNACISKERSDPRNRRLGVTDKQLIEYCECMSASAGRVLTPSEFVEAVKNNGVPGQGLQQKINEAYPTCFSAAASKL